MFNVQLIRLGEPRVLKLRPTAFILIGTLILRPNIRLELNVIIFAFLLLPFPFLLLFRFTVRPHHEDSMMARSRQQA